MLNGVAGLADARKTAVADHVADPLRAERVAFVLVERGRNRIARKVGYEDEAAFRRLFRKLAGMTPGEYRRNFKPPRF